MQLSLDYMYGLTDGEGCFAIDIRRWQKNKTGFSVSACFCISLVEKDSYVLSLVQQTLDCGTIVRKIRQQQGKSWIRQAQIQYHVTNIKDITKKVIPFFDKGKLIIKADTYALWKEAVYLIQNDKHLTANGLLKIAAIRDRINHKKNKKFIYEQIAEILRKEPRNHKI